MAKVKVSDYIVEHLLKKGLNNAFLISGGGIIHVVDSIGKSKMRTICNHHEQAAAIAAEAYARIKGVPGLCVVTSGPGGTNAITGVMGAWLDSIPMIVLSGQIRTEIMGAGKNGLRQLGDQEINIVDIVKPITKYAAVVMHPQDILFYLDKALFLSTNGRPGPVWLDLPLNIQGSYIDEKDLRPFDKNSIAPAYDIDPKKLKHDVRFAIKKIQEAERPVLFIGNGIRFSRAQNTILELINKLKIPVITGFAGFDLLSPKNKYFGGRPGTIGQRVGNFTLQNTDFLVVIGSRLNIRMIGYNYETFARAAYKIVVDIDKAELNKKTIRADKKLNYDAKDFINEMLSQLKNQEINPKKEWLKTVARWKEKYPTVLPEYWKQEKYVNPYCFIETLSKHIKKDDVIALSDATASICTYQAMRFPQGTRIITNSGCAAMGYGLPAGIGACVGNNKKNTICIDGDGSLQVNIHELQTLVHYKLPLKLFIYNNNGYVSIRLTQKNLFEGRIFASDPKGGVSIPNLKKIAYAYGIKYIKISNHKEMDIKIRKALSLAGPVFCEVMLSSDHEFLPKSSSKKLPDGSLVSRPLEDMYPFLSKEELKENMFIPLVDEI